MKYGVFSANEWMYPDSDPSQGKKKIQLDAAGNSFACVQVLCECQSLAWEWFPGEDGMLEAPEINQLISVYVDKNTGSYGHTAPKGAVAEYATRQAPFDVYDAMEPVQSNVINADQHGMIALYLRFPTKGMEGKEYEGTLRLTGSDSVAEIPVSLKVYQVTVPDDESLRMTNWFNVADMAKFHDAELWSEEHWEMIESYGRFMREGRQTDFWIEGIMSTCTKDEEGEYHFDFSRAERLIRMYLDMGFRYIEGFTPFVRKDWGDDDFIVRIFGEDVLALSDEGYKYAKAYFTSWYELLKKNNWVEITVQHVGDEPLDNNAEQYRILSGMIRKWMPGIKLIEAVETPHLNGAVDIWVPQSIRYVARQDLFEAKRKLGDEFWFYTCCNPGGWYLNRLLDQDLIRTRYLHWANIVYDFTGYLHWGLNIYSAPKSGDPYRHACDDPANPGGPVLPAGDTHILYPKGRQILRSVRFEMMRAGCEDYELFRMMQQKSEVEANRLVKTCVRTFTDYTIDMDIFDLVYRKLLERLEA